MNSAYTTHLRYLATVFEQLQDVTPEEWSTVVAIAKREKRAIEKLLAEGGE